MIDIFVPHTRQLPTEQERLQKAADEILRIADEHITHFDTDLVFAIGIIANALCRSDYLERGQLVQSLRAAHGCRLKTWNPSGYSPLRTLADLLEDMGNCPEPDGKPTATWLREVIEGGKQGD